MPDDLKISAMTPITGANIAADDVIPVVDVSTSTNRNITRDEYLSEVKRVIFSRTNYDAAPEEGVLTWDADEKTLSLGLNGGDTVLQIGQESHIRVRNNSGALIANGTVVMQVGTIGNSGRLTIAKAVADGSVDGHRILGITTEDIANGADGLVTNFGKVRQINTTAFSDGAVLYANPAVPGGMTATRPAHPNAVVVVAFVVHSHSSGTLFVHPSYESQPEMVTLTGTQTLTNKTINLASNTLVATSAQLRAALTDETGTGAAVFAGSPALTGTPTAPTAAQGTNTTQVATTEFATATAAAQAALYAGPRVDTFAQLVALTSVDVAVGQYVQVRSLGAWYRRVVTGGMIGPASTVVAVLDFDVMPGADGYDVRAWGAAGDGVADDTIAIRAALVMANAKRVIGLAATILHAGATVVIPPLSYTLTSIVATLPVNCHLRAAGARFIVPAAYAGEVMRLGDDRPTYNLAGAKIETPDVYKPTGSGIVTGSVGIRTVNCNKCRITYGRVSYFDYNLHFGGIGDGTVYCDLYIGQLNYGNHLLHIVPGSGGWFNANTIHGGNMRLGGSRVAGQSHVYIDGLTSTAVVGNIFIAPAYEGDGAEYIIDAKGAYGNVWKSVYYETGAASRAVTVSGDTITRVGHGFVVGDMLMFSASVLPTGMFDVTPYWVVATPNADTFKVSQSRSGAAVTFGSSGTSVVTYLQGRCRFDGTTSLCLNNRIETRFSPPSVLLDYIQVGQAQNNGEDSFDYLARTINTVTDYPIFRGRQKRATTSTRAVFAAYPAAIDPEAQPGLWSVGLSDRGVMFASNTGAEIGRITNTAGILQYEGADNGVTAEIPSGFRSPSYTTLGTSSVPANGRFLTTITVTGAAVGDYVVPMTASALPDGIAIAWARVSAANTVQFCFHNWTGSPIDIVGAQIKALVYRTFY